MPDHPDPFPWEDELPEDPPDTTPSPTYDYTDTEGPDPDADVGGLTAYVGEFGTPEEIGETLDALADVGTRDRLLAQGRDTIRTAVRQRADARRKTREDTTPQVKHSTEIRDEVVGAANDADVLTELAAAFNVGATEAKQIAGELLDELPARAGRPRRSVKVGDGQGHELSVTVSPRTELSVTGEEVDEVLVARLVGEVGKPGVLPLSDLPVKAYAAGARDAIAALRGVLASSPTYRSTALDALVTELENAEEVDLAKRLRKAYGRVDKGEPGVKLARKPAAGDEETEGAGS